MEEGCGSARAPLRHTDTGAFQLLLMVPEEGARCVEAGVSGGPASHRVKMRWRSGSVVDPGRRLATGSATHLAARGVEMFLRTMLRRPTGTWEQL